MEKRYFESIGEEISLLGFGCMRFPLVEGTQEIDKQQSEKLLDMAIKSGVNYFDTAYPYHEKMSEPFVGEALKKYPRESWRLATKMPLWQVKTIDDAERIFAEQLENCQVDYFDFYLLHAMDNDRFAQTEKLGLYEFFRQKQKEGKIRRLGFSFHDTAPVLKKVVTAHSWDFVQIQLNYLDWDLQDAKTQYEILVERNIPVIVMEPVRGGMLAKLNEKAAAILKNAKPDASVASWAIRYAASLPGVLTVLSGMSDQEQVQDNLNTLGNFSPLTPGERQTLTEAEQVFRASGTIPCTGCRYCMDCPTGVDIPRIFALYNQFCDRKDKDSFVNDLNRLGADHGPDCCVSCGLCTQQCPQHIDIPGWMTKISAWKS